ncbi:ATP-bind-4 multi-domain protein [Pyrenophora teres f. maculata]|nr:ATP-bind-4 multi-domain protein [Pyrenophora teres f. maculata]
MASSLNVVALISGGKDSLFSILHCQANGHTIVALANLHPAPATGDDDDDNEDINSYMYQTVGHSVIPLYGEALGIPLYRQEIAGTAVDSSRDYAADSQKQEKDETEDLVPLLRKVMEAHPEVNAVSTGAILSTYQRTRVESVALRLGLTPLSYLWQYPLLPPYTQSSLLHDMTAVGQKAIIIKTASGGLDEDFLGLDVASQATIARLANTMGRYGDAGDGAILGEGGEFETLALDGPQPLWKKSIRIDSGPPGKLDGGQAVLRIKESLLEEKTNDDARCVDALRIPELFDEEFKRILETTEITAEDAELASNKTFRINPQSDYMFVVERLPRHAAKDNPTVFLHSNLTGDTRPISPATSPSRQLIKIFLSLDHFLKQSHLSRASVNHATLLLRDMADFSVLNPVYAQYFSHVNPPARVTIAVGDVLPKDVDVMLSVIVDKYEKNAQEKVTTPVKRQGLHVQGRSYWAPANIGPYSQAISISLPLNNEHNESSETPTCGEIVYIAGQIPLVPASMAVYADQGFKGQAVLSLQHLWRIGRAKNVKWWTAAVGFIPASQHPEDRVRVAQDVWKAIHAPAHDETADEEDEDAHIDPWDRLNQHHVSAFSDTTVRSQIPDRAAVSADSTASTPPCFIAQVASLPRDVDIEWSATGLTCSSIQCTRNSQVPHLSITTSRDTRSRFLTLEVHEQSDLNVLRDVGERAWTCATLYVGRGFEWCGDGVGAADLEGVQWIPCQRVWGENGREVRGVFVGRIDG